MESRLRPKSGPAYTKFRTDPIELDQIHTEEIELDQIHTEEKKLETALDRYFDAFETGNLTPDACTHRIDDLHRRRRGIQQRRTELEAADKPPVPPTPAELIQLADDTADIMRAGNPANKKRSSRH